MTGTARFEIQEREDADSVRLILTGELDRTASPILEDRLVRLRAKRLPVVLDLSHLDFVDTTALQVLIRAIGDARIDGWQLDIDRNLSPPVENLFRLAHLDHLIEDVD